jgi:alpha-galactosidase
MKDECFSTGTKPKDMEKSRLWTGHFFANPENLPFSFIYDGKKISGIPTGWNPVFQKRLIDANLMETVYEGNDTFSGLGIRVECLEYLDYPVVEWVVWFTNKGKIPTPLIHDILALDGEFEGSSPVLYHCNGDYYSEDGYTPQETPLTLGDSMKFAPNGGRPCDGAFPYFRIQFEGCGLTMAVGWPAQWSTGFTGTKNGVHVAAGQEKTNLRLMPGESVRTPRMTLMSWIGDTSKAVNLWRRWYLEHIIPKPDGKSLRTALVCAATDDGEEFTNANEENQIRYIERAKKLGFDYDVWWIDAGWYPCRDEKGDKRWWRTGTWEPDPERFPNGFKNISEKVTENGAKLLVWFEPERVHAGSRLDLEHPEWLLKTRENPSDANRLLNLGNSECRRWLTDYICKLIKDNGIGIYRQDFNFPPLQYWRDNDGEDRQGINENLHAQGYLQYWDDILMRNPGIWIDSCSSGGRRNDLETMRRSVPLHYTDYGYGKHPVKLAFHHTLYSWIPYFKEVTLSWDVCNPGEDTRFDKQVDSFSFHCGMAPMMFASLDIRRNDYDFELATKMIGIWRKAANIMLHGDYYPLTQFSKSNEKWLVWQFDIPENKKGLIQGIRFADCPEENITVFPKAFCSNRTYVFENPETQEIIEFSGSNITQDGFTFKLSKRSAAIWFYKVKDN